MKISVVGNCQALGMANCLSIYCPNHEVRIERPNSGETVPADILLAQSGVNKQWIENGAWGRIVAWPSIYFGGFHPDIVFPTQRQKIGSPTGGWHSSIALAAWIQGLNRSEAISLYRDEVFECLGFYSYFSAGRTALIAELNRCNLPGEELFAKWASRGCFMHGPNHPKLSVLADIARSLATKLGIISLERASCDASSFFADHMLVSAVWPVFPPIAKRLGLPSSGMIFKSGSSRWNDVSRFYNLASFVDESYRNYDAAPREVIDFPRENVVAYQSLSSLARQKSRIEPNESAKSGSPYVGLPDYQFWRRAVERPKMRDVDPVVSGKFRIGKHQKLATAGSCFAQHISRTLSNIGFNYLVSEDAPPGMQPEEALKQNYGVFSARYGNIYTARQLRQLLDRAYGRFAPEDTAWQRPDGRWDDPFRPKITPEGFDSPRDVIFESAKHLALVRQMFEELDIFVFTLGLTECWRSKQDGAVFPLAPGVVAGSMDPSQHEFVNCSYEETVEDMEAFLLSLSSVNPNARTVLTVSPIPLIATYENRHILVSTTYSKSVLRTAAEDLAAGKRHVAYFPSYEVITGSFTRGAYFEDDLRSVRPDGVEHVMSLFLRHYTDYASDSPQLTPEDVGSAELSLIAESEENAAVVCDEVWMDPV